MELFYTNNISDGIATLDPGESTHCVRVLRHREGDIINITDGVGFVYSARITEAKPAGVKAEVLTREAGHDNRGYTLHMAVALTKNFERFEWFLEKAVEIGVDRITPLVCDHSERRVFKYDRAHRIILSAAKQSLKSVLPVLDDVTKASELLEMIADQGSTPRQERGLNIMGHCRDGEKSSLPSILREFGPVQGGKAKILIMIGPEGDFSVEEIAKAKEAGFSIMHLGESRMRVETAAIASVGAVYIDYLDSRDYLDKR